MWQARAKSIAFPTKKNDEVQNIYLLCTSPNTRDSLCFPVNNHFIDGISHRGKFLLILCHYIARIHFFVMMKVEGVRKETPFRLFYLLQRKYQNKSLLSVLNSTLPSGFKISSYLARNSLEVKRRFAWRAFGHGSEKFR